MRTRLGALEIPLVDAGRCRRDADGRRLGLCRRADRRRDCARCEDWRGALASADTNAIGGGVLTYRAGGKQLVAVAAGFKSRVWPVPAESNRVIVFGLP
jgi:hypothetical protein